MLLNRFKHHYTEQGVWCQVILISCTSQISRVPVQFPTEGGLTLKNPWVMTWWLTDRQVKMAQEGCSWCDSFHPAVPCTCQQWGLEHHTSCSPAPPASRQQVKPSLSSFYPPRIKQILPASSSHQFVNSASVL